MRPGPFSQMPRPRGLRVHPSRRHVLALSAAVCLVAATIAVVAGRSGPAETLALGAVLALSLAVLPRIDWSGKDPLTRLRQRRGLLRGLDRSLRRCGGKRDCAALVVEIDGFKQVEERFDRAAVEAILLETARRLRLGLREADVAARLEGSVFGVALAPSRHLDLEAAIQLASRIQSSLSEPVRLGGVSAHLTVSVGFALADRLERPTAEYLLHGATLALFEAERHGPAAIRSYSPAMKQRIADRTALSSAVGDALAGGEIGAFFQPQVDCRTGRLTGVEALARWNSPGRGTIPPIEFIPAIEEAGLMHKLGRKMLDDGLGALKLWRMQGFDVPCIAVNFSASELRDPCLLDSVRSALRRHDLQAEDLVVEVLETVAASRAEDTVVRNLSGLARLGCAIDLDDFGTGHASITTIRQLSIQRIKIDRSFVTRIDSDLEQQEMVAAILTMAERLGLATLAEGVETPEERDMLARLGCGHLQGYCIARPMAPGEMESWIADRGGGGDAIPFRKRA